MDIQQLATIFSSTFDPTHQQEAEKRLDEVKIELKFKFPVDHAEQPRGKFLLINLLTIYFLLVSLAFMVL